MTWADLVRIQVVYMPLQTSRISSIHASRRAPRDGRDASSPALRASSVIEKVAIRLLSPLEMDSFFPAKSAESDVTLMAWPLLLSKQQLARYLGMSGATLLKVCPVAPIDVGANMVRYSRPQIDEWVATLPARDVRGRQTALRRVEPAPDDATGDRRSAALSRAAARTKRQSRSR